MLYYSVAASNVHPLTLSIHSHTAKYTMRKVYRIAMIHRKDTIFSIVQQKEALKG